VSHHEPYVNFDPVGVVGGFKGSNVSAAGCGLKSFKARFGMEDTDPGSVAYLWQEKS
jgi:hypothetical protein